MHFSYFIAFQCLISSSLWRSKVWFLLWRSLRQNLQRPESAFIRSLSSLVEYWNVSIHHSTAHYFTQKDQIENINWERSSSSKIKFFNLDQVCPNLNHGPKDWASKVPYTSIIDATFNLKIYIYSLNKIKGLHRFF